MNLGSRLNQILQEKNLTVSQLARESGVSAQTLYAMIKRDSNKADMEIIAKLLRALEMDFMEFWGESPVKVTKQKEEPRERRREIEDYLL